MEKPRRITPDGREQIFDEDLLEWRDVQKPLDPPPMQQELFIVPKDSLMMLNVEAPKPEYKFVCERCGGNLQKFIRFCGWEEITIDPEDGDDINIVDGDYDSIHKIEYRCRSGCGFVAAQAWFDMKRNERKKEAKELVSFPEKAIQSDYLNWDDFWTNFWRQETPEKPKYKVYYGLDGSDRSVSGSD